MQVVPDLCNYLITTGAITSAAEFSLKVTDRINEVMRLTFLQIKDRLDRKFGSFEVFGYDFMLDADCNPQLLEININPALFLDTEVQAQIIPSLVKDVCNMALDIHEPFKTESSGKKIRSVFDSYQGSAPREEPHKKYSSLDYTVLYSE